MIDPLQDANQLLISFVYFCGWVTKKLMAGLFQYSDSPLSTSLYVSTNLDLSVSENIELRETKQNA